MGNEGHHQPPFSAEIMNTWSYTSNPNVYFHDIYMDNFIFTRTD